MRPSRIRDDGGRANLQPAEPGYAGYEAGEADQYRGGPAALAADGAESYAGLALARVTGA